MYVYTVHYIYKAQRQGLYRQYIMSNAIQIPLSLYIYLYNIRKSHFLVDGILGNVLAVLYADTYSSS